MREVSREQRERNGDCTNKSDGRTAKSYGIRVAAEASRNNGVDIRYTSIYASIASIYERREGGREGRREKVERGGERERERGGITAHTI